jgi:inorganic phosphate transporter, PiT family
VDVVAIAAALGLAFVLGISDAPNATAALVASRAAGWRGAIAFSFVLHLLGALLAGTAVALTIDGLVSADADDVSAVYGAACLAAIAFVSVGARRGIPTSATYGMIGGLVGAGVAAGGWGAINWGGMDGWRPHGVVGVLFGLVLSPILGVAAGFVLRSVLAHALRSGTRRLLDPVRGAVWLAAGSVALSDGMNDGQKAMGLATGVLVATGRLSSFSIPFWVRGTTALALALGTALGGGRVIRRVGTGYYRPDPVDVLAAEISGAGVIFGAAAVGAPVSTSETVTAAFVGVGADRHPRHVRWAGVFHTVSAWAVTVPACAALAALLFACARLMA